MSATEIFESPQHRKEVNQLGMWVFLVTEVMFFGGFFGVLFVYTFLHPAAFQAASRELSVTLGGVNTAVLLLSSLLVVFALLEAERGNNRGVARYLWGTIGLAVVFLVIKGFEYADKFQHHLVPGANFRFEETAPQGTELFFSIYFVMTGLHALHVIVGIGLLGWVAARAQKNEFSRDYHVPVEVCGLYWHLVDVIWIFIFPFLYLIGRGG